MKNVEVVVASMYGRRELSKSNRVRKAGWFSYVRKGGEEGGLYGRKAAGEEEEVARSPLCRVCATSVFCQRWQGWGYTWTFRMNSHLLWEFVSHCLVRHEWASMVGRRV